MSENQTESPKPEETQAPAPLYENTLYLSPNIDYFQNGDDFFVYHNLYGYILKMSEDLVDFLEFFHEAPHTAQELEAQFDQVFGRETLEEFLSIFRTLACLIPNADFETQKTLAMYPTTARWITVDQTNEKAIVIYAFDTQTRDRVARIQLDAWESELWSYINGTKATEDIAAEMAEKHGELLEDVKIRIAAALAQWTHCDVQAVKLSAEPCGKFKGSRFGVPPYLISTMPYQKVTAHVRTILDEDGNVTSTWEEPKRVLPANLTYVPVSAETLEADRRSARLSALFSEPHAALRNRNYGKALYDVITKHAPISGNVCEVLEVGTSEPNTARAFIKAAVAANPELTLNYTMFIADEKIADELKAAVADLKNISIVVGDIEKIEELLSGKTFDIIFSNEFMANLPSVNVRKMSLGGGDDEEDEDDEDRPDDGERELKPAHTDASKLTFIGEGDAINLIFKYKLNLVDAPEDFLLNSGSLRLLGRLSKLVKFSSHIFMIEFGEDIKYPVQTYEDGCVAYAQHFGVLKQAARALGFVSTSTYWMEDIDIDRELKMFATTRSQFKAMRAMLAEHGVALEHRPYSEDEFRAILAKAGRTSVNEINFEPAEDRISGLVPHAYKLLHIFKELEF